MSSARQRPLAIPRPAVARRRAAAVGLGLTLAVGLPLLAGCSAGQVTQTSNQVSAVNGAQGTVGKMALRNVKLVFPQGGGHFYQRGESAPLTAFIVNTGDTEDELTAVRSPVAPEIVTPQGQAKVPPHTAVQAVALSQGAGSTGAPTAGSPLPSPSPSPSPTAQPTSQPTTQPTAQPTSPPTTGASEGTSLAQGQISIVLANLLEDVRPGMTIPVTFLFRQAGELTLQVPIGPPPAGGTES